MASTAAQEMRKLTNLRPFRPVDTWHLQSTFYLVRLYHAVA